MLAYGRLGTLERSRASGQNRAQQLGLGSAVGIITGAADLARALLSEGLAWPLDLDESRQQSERAVSAVARRAAGRAGAVDRALWQCVQSELVRHEVVVPFAEPLSRLLDFDALSHEASRLEADFVRVIALISSSALLYQRQRQLDERGRLVATLDDYAMIYPLVDELVALSAQDLAPQTTALAAAVRQLCAAQQRATAKPEHDRGPARTATDSAAIERSELEQHLGWAKRTVNKWLRHAEAFGLVDIERSSGRSAARVRPGPRAPARRGLLPSAEALRARWTKPPGPPGCSPVAGSAGASGPSSSGLEPASHPSQTRKDRA